MAISKIMNMKDSGNAYHGKHLKRSIDYITEGWKTQDGQLVGVLNCLPDNVYEQMRDTKQLFDKNSGRQGYHIVLSFKPREADNCLVSRICSYTLSGRQFNTPTSCPS